MEGCRDERGSHIAYNTHLLWGLYSSLTYVSLHMPPLKRDTWLPRAQPGNDKSSLLSLYLHPRPTHREMTRYTEKLHMHRSASFIVATVVIDADVLSPSACQLGCNVTRILHIEIMTSTLCASVFPTSE